MEFVELPEYGLKINRDGECYKLNNNRLIRSRINTHGYRIINHPLKNTNVYIHRLMCIAYKQPAINEFVANNPNKTWVIDHIDRNKLNNSLDNLRIVTQSDNLRNREMRRPIAHKRPVRVTVITTQIIYEYQSIADAIKQHGGGLLNVLQGKCRTNNGVTAEYVN